MQLRIFKKYDVFHGFSDSSFGSMAGKNGDRAAVKFLHTIGYDADIKNLVWAQQVFGSKIHICNSHDSGRIISGVDGLISNIPGQILSVIAADCMPILIFDPENRVVAVLHGSRQSLIKGIIPKAIKIMGEKFGSKPKDLLIGIGPHIRKCHYWLKPKTYDGLAKSSFKKYFVFKDKKVYFDLKKIALNDLLLMGIKKSNIDDCDVCTYCDYGKYFSARKEEKYLKIYSRKHPRFAGFIGISSLPTRMLFSKSIGIIAKDVASIIKKGQVVVVPTDTVYGLLCDATNKKAVDRVFKIKDRNKNNPLPVFVKDLKMAQSLAKIDAETEDILRKIWPGQVTAILHQKKGVKIFGLNKKTIALRIPNYKFIERLLDEFGRPLVCTSANISGRPPLLEAKNIISQFHKNNLPDYVVDGGKLKKRLPSTVVDLTKENPYITREGNKIPKL